MQNSVDLNHNSKLYLISYEATKQRYKGFPKVTNLTEKESIGDLIHFLRRQAWRE